MSQKSESRTRTPTRKIDPTTIGRVTLRRLLGTAKPTRDEIAERIRQKLRKNGSAPEVISLVIRHSPGNLLIGVGLKLGVMSDDEI